MYWVLCVVLVDDYMSVEFVMCGLLFVFVVELGG